MSKDKYLDIFSPHMEAIVFIVLQIFFATRVVLKIGEYPWIFPSFGWGIFGHMMRLDQSRASENIWWIIMSSRNIRQYLTKYWPISWPILDQVLTVTHWLIYQLIYWSIYWSRPPIRDMISIMFAQQGKGKCKRFPGLEYEYLSLLFPGWDAS